MYTSLVSALVGLSASLASFQDAPKELLDAQGESLTPGAVVRIGKFKLGVGVGGCGDTLRGGCGDTLRWSMSSNGCGDTLRWSMSSNDI
jgi:hypothetical protein